MPMGARSRRNDDRHGRLGRKGRTCQVQRLRAYDRVHTRELCRARANVALIARDASELSHAKNELDQFGTDVLTIQCDLLDPAQIQTVVQQTLARFGKIDILINNAGIIEVGPLEHMSRQDFERSMGVHFWAPFELIMQVIPEMRARRGGRIVNIASLSGVYATEKFPGLTAYNVSKYGVIGLTEAIAVEGKAVGISAICLSPGAVDTQMLRQANPELRPGLAPPDVAELIVALLDSPMVAASGANIPLFSNA